MDKSVEYLEINILKDKIINNILLYGVILGFLTYIISLFGWSRTSFKVSFLIDFLSVLLYFTTFLLRKKLSVKAKSFLIIICIFILVFADFFKYGIYADNKVFLIVLPFFTFFIYSLRNTIYVSILATFFFVAFGIFYCLKIFKPTIDYYVRAISIDTWIINLILIILVAFVVIIIVNQFIETYKKLVGDLVRQNNELISYREKLELLVVERTNDLEKANKELKVSNVELSEKSRIINDQNIELKTTMQYLKNTQAQLIQSEKMASIGVLTAGVSHEINNPLNFILGAYVGLENYLEETGQKNNETLAIILDSIKTGVDRAADIVRGLNQLSRSDEELKEDCVIQSIIDNCLIICKNQLDNRIKVEKEYYHEPLITFGNAGKLHQAFLNILNNAIQSIETNGKISVLVKKEDNDIIIEIKDTGCGITAENLSKITIPFYTTKEPGKGPGLGLSQSYNFIKEHSGSLDFESEINKGTTARITLPLK